MNCITIAALAGTAMLFAGTADAQQGVDFSKVEIKTTDLGNKTYMLEGQGGDITVAVGTDGIIMVDSQFAPLHDKIKAAIAKISPLPIKYLVNTHYHLDHVGGNAAFHRDGATIVTHDNVRLRLAAGTINATTGNKTPPMEADAIPTLTYLVGGMKVEVGGRVAQLRHVINAHTDGDTWVYFPDANLLVTGDTYGSRNYPNIDWGSGGSIDGMILAIETFLKAANDMTKIVPGHGPAATKANLQEFHDMMVTVRDRVKKLVDEGKSEQEVLAANPIADLDSKWSGQGITSNPSFLRNVYNGFRNRN
jgi:glyoxylase-like metal-dependent hydrolase (beta-lactamase superfamily II)